jgi:hypothetical protein
MNQKESSDERRNSNDRRKFTYTAYSPERRSGLDRRAASNRYEIKVA